MENIKIINFSLINIDKPTGPTSFSVSEYIKEQLNLNKTSHMGTLDPKVTGVLPITLGRACKLASYFISHDKTYIGILHTHKEQDINYLQDLINKNFVGKIKQIPPHKSSVKRAEREREVYNFNFLESLENRKDFLFECKVQGGTYIRKICSDLGEMIGGAHMEDLRRTAAGIFSESKLYSLEEFTAAAEEYKRGNIKPLKKMLIPAETAIKEVMPSLQVQKKSVKSLYTGKPLLFKDLEKNTSELEKGSVFALFSDGKFIGVYKKTSEKEIFAKPEFVYN